MNHRRTWGCFMVLSLSLSACNMPFFSADQGSPISIGDATGTVTVQVNVLKASPTITVVAASNTQVSPASLPETKATVCAPIVTVKSRVNVRSGPGTFYEITGVLSPGATAGVSGRNSDGTWWVIDYVPGPGGHGWVAANSVSAFCIPASLAVVVAPPTPKP
jgi:uncharacterized protein YgiM (DUF1202 family)